MFERLARRILTMIGAARITTFNDAGSVQKLQVKVNGLETIDNLANLMHFGFSSGPPIGTDVAIVFIGGDRSNGVVVASNHQASRPKDLKAGEAMIYSQDGKQVYLTASGGIIVNANGQDVEVNSATNVTINASEKIRAVTPRLECTGDIIDNCDSQTSTLADLREAYDAHKHDVVNVQTGGSTIATTAPNDIV
ncbi:phage baseplate assembly protein V [Burkholderia metallica]|uniref:phage baseplate assembly protein V n=1 Tax=Burkholderia metallica TaxID=488729 RepID=UPI00157A3F33|nr:phage baseplate assembly protein V [Burkholderia metallica]NTZ82191.1 phage baseplate assembly protein V [Burkholderia metallica]